MNINNDILYTHLTLDTHVCYATLMHTTHACVIKILEN